jgi:UDP-2,3-diacylglucosamine pyrophosphatase LpxH
MNGDIVDGWQLKKYGNWKKRHTKFIRVVMKMIENYDTQVIYTRGNHDDFLDAFIPLSIGRNFTIQRDYIHVSNGVRYLVTHGDIFDSVTTNLKWLSKLGDVGYTLLLWINKIYNEYRRKKGLPYYSLSAKIKAKVKSAVSYISDYEIQLADLAKTKNCQGVICGHIHQAAIKYYGEVLYLNSGDWVESLSALVEDYNGEWSLVYYNETEPKYQGVNDEDLDSLEVLAEADFDLSRIVGL